MNIRYLFGENNIYYYEFTLHTYNVPNTDNKIVTVMMTSSNVANKPIEYVNQYVSELVQFLAKTCVEHTANYDAYHNHLMPFSFEESSNIADAVNATIQSILNGGV
jgi:hypothetical protein